LKKYFGISLTLIAFVSLLMFSVKQNSPNKLAQGSHCEPFILSHCEFKLPEVGTINVRVKPYPFMPEQSHKVWLEAESPIQILHGELVGINMNMGKIPLIASQITHTQVEIEVIPVSCINPNMQWQVQLLLQSKEDIFPVSLNFEINE